MLLLLLHGQGQLEYWNIYANLLDEKSKKEFTAKFFGKDNKKQELHKQEEVDEILKQIQKAKYVVQEFP